MALKAVVALAIASVWQDGTRHTFEDQDLGSVPEQWTVPPGVQAGFGAEVVEENAHEGERCVRLFRRPEGEAPFGNLMQSLDATPYRGKRVRFAFSARAGRDAVAQGWMRVDRAGGGMGFFDNMGDRPIREREWTRHEIVGGIDDDAERLNVGLMLIQGDEACYDDVVLEVVGERRAPQPPRALSERGLDNLVALARLYGVVRWFHPSDEAAEADWEHIAFAGVEAVEPLEDALALAGGLQALFAPVAPAARVFPVGAPAELPRELTELPAEGRASVRHWRHVGMGQAEGGAGGGVYSSRRLRERLRDGALPEGTPDPAAPWTAELAGGIACAVPLALYEAKGATVPAAAAKSRAVDAGFEPRGDDRTTRLAAVVIAWNVFQHFYPYFDVVEADWDAELRRALASAATDADEAAFLVTLRRMVAALHDGHGHVAHGSAWKSGGLPFTWDVVAGELLVTHVPDGSSHDLLPGDRVLEVDGRDALEALDAAGAMISGATPQWIRRRALQDLALGNAGEPCALRIEPADGGEPRTLTVPRVLAAAVPAEPRPAELIELEPGLWYVDVSRVDDAELEEALPSLADAAGIVWDFRGYPGALSAWTLFPHLTSEPLTSQQWHVPVLTRPDREGMTFERGGEWRIPSEEPLLAARHAFLIDGRAISYAESCLGIVEHYGLGALVGGPTAGTNGNVNPFTLPGGYQVSWTGLKVLKHDGSRHHGVGILPTVPVERTRAGVAEGRDEILERALELVRE